MKYETRYCHSQSCGIIQEALFGLKETESELIILVVRGKNEWQVWRAREKEVGTEFDSGMEGAVGKDMEGKIANGHLKRIERKVKGEAGWVFWSRVIFMEGLLPCVG